MNLSPAKKRFVDLASAKYGEGAVMTRDEVKAFVVRCCKCQRKI